MTTAHNPISPEEVERRLADDPQPKPPIELLDNIRAEIPKDLDARGTDGRRRGPRPQTWLLAATLATVVLGGFLAYRLGETNRWSTTPVPPDQTQERRQVIVDVEGDQAISTKGAAVEGEVSVDAAKTHPTKASTASETAVPEEPQTESRFESQSAQRRQLDALVHPSEVTTEEHRLRRELERLRSEESPATDPATESFADEVVVMAEAPAPQATSRSVAGSGAPTPSTGGTHEPNDAPYGDMFFRAYGTNPFLDPEEDRLSTFGLDVDTGSYTVTRNYLKGGNLPPAAAVRVEEFLNYFDYQDPAPRRGDFALSVEGAPSPFAEHQDYVLLRFGIQGRQIADRDRPPSTLIFVVDVSGSMQRENRLGLVQRSLSMLLGQLREDDQVGLVVYGSRGQVLLEPTRDHSRIQHAIDRLRAEGSTNAEEGLVLAYDLAREFYRDGGNHRVILCSDGVANVGRTGPDSILARIGREADAGIELTTVGFGMGNYNDVLMEQLADRGDGRYAYVDDLKEARRLFVEELTGTLQTIAADAKAQVEFNPEAVERYRLIGYENRDIADERFRDDTVDAGEIGAGHHVTALYEVKLRDDLATRREIATLRLRYHSRQAGEVIEEELPVRRRDLADSMGDASDSLQLAALVAEFGEILKGSYWAKDGDLDRVLRGARDVARATRDPKVAEFRDLVETAVRLSASAESDPDWIEE